MTTLPAFMVRQHALTNDEWIQYIQTLAERIKLSLNFLTLKPLGNIGILWDDFGRHSLCGYSIGNQSNLSQRGIFPPEDDRISVNEFFYEEGDVEKKSPTRIIQRLWGLSRQGEWMTIEVRSDITYEDVDIHKHQRRFIPTSVEVLPAVLNEKFFKFTGLTPKKFWYLFKESIITLLNKRRLVLAEVDRLLSSIRLDEHQLSLIPGGKLKYGE